MTGWPRDPADFRRYRNSRLYRSLGRTLRVYNRLLVERLHARGFEDFSPAFPALLSNVDTGGTRIGVVAARAGVTRQAAGQLLKEIERCGYVELSSSRDDARATMVRYTARGRRLLTTVIELVEEIEGDFADTIGEAAFEALRDGLLRIADGIDPGGALGAGDQPAATAPRTRRSRAGARAEAPRPGARRRS